MILTNPKIIHKDNVLFVEWRCPLCGEPTDEKVAKEHLLEFIETYSRRHRYETYCAKCIMKVANASNRRIRGFY